MVPPGTIIHEVYFQDLFFENGCAKNPFFCVQELFEPVGYSMNGLIPDSDQYITIHITPEPEFSYISFETNQRRQCLYKQITKVLECFK